ncbi:cell filamentation protein Fic [Marinobacter daepoensis]|uniref:Cell filamentation protein Fic n=1 Tax=Marinobacter daepoensis TaxID=262077 RepID=A0ABS3BKH5_9GAMM|nr:cell filamentation protein Fic [Marinobacter daepoensis]MBN7771237.1 cell filamentation protein Fic [Marinobacter daepoensis]MBY6079099.1 cell filamentation protein Fic [Marinobacter daepoensis]
MSTVTDNYWSMSPNPDKALMLAQRAVSVFVHDAVRLEGINFTLPEVQTLLQGVTVGGHKLSDQQIAVNQGEAWKLLFHLIREGSFTLMPDCAMALHAVAAKEEALEWGCFRRGSVLIAGTDYEPPAASELPERFANMVDGLEHMDDIYDQAIHLFLTMARCQFFYDVNKFMMNGHLLNSGYPAINIPASRQLEFNELMLRFYESDDQCEMNRFVRSCMDERAVRIMKEA